MATNIKPLNDRVIIDTGRGDKTPGGIFIPDTATDRPKQGKVVAVGEGKLKEDGTRQPIDVQVGDEVLFGEYAGSKVEIDGQKLLIMREEEIYGIIQRAGASAK